MESANTGSIANDPEPLSTIENVRQKDDAMSLNTSQTGPQAGLEASNAQLPSPVTEGDTQPGAEDIRAEASNPPLAEASWTQHKSLMARLTAAIEHASAIIDVGTDDDTEATSESVEKRYINLQINGGPRHVIPWAACSTWPRMEGFLQRWFSEDEKALSDLSDGRFMLEYYDGGVILPSVWEQVLESSSEILFSQQHVPGISTTGEDEEVLETKYENRVQYKVSYFKRSAYGGDHLDFLESRTYDERLEFEVANEFEKLPVLEECVDVTSGPHSIHVIGRSGKSTKLRPGDEMSEPVLKLHSPWLLNILRSVIEHSAEPPAGDGQGLDAGTFVYPYRDLYHHLDALKAYKLGDYDLRAKHDGTFNRKADEHIELLEKYLETHPKIPYKQARARWAGTTPVTTFSTLWLLMKPGTDMYVRESDGSLNRYVLDRMSGGVSLENGKREPKKYTAMLWHLAFLPPHLIQKPREIDIQVFDDEREITELPFFPVSFVDDHDKGHQRMQLLENGKKYFAYAKRPCFLQYTGQGLRTGSKTYKRERVVAEHRSYPWIDETWTADLGHHYPYRTIEDLGESIRVARCECKDCKPTNTSEEVYARAKFSDYDDINLAKKEELTEHQYLIMPSHIFAFVLKDRLYDLLDVATLDEPDMADTAIDKLVMDNGSKELLKAVAKTYTDNKERFSADFINGKGEGQIILLHGPPGTGKTLTAESVAEFTKRPLLSITAADLGHKPDELEKSLLRYFRRANEWDAVVLLDEADIYLERRSIRDLKRNSIVSVFLRALDYFQGILFLTTNRVGQFDEAFKSRIHLSLGYEKLNDSARAQIWGNLFQKLKDDFKNGGQEIRYDYDAKNYVTKSDEVKELKWNGREIRNAFQTAVALAVYDSKHKNKGTIPEMTEYHLKQVVVMSSAFRTYMDAAHNGMNDSALAFKDGNRDDDFPSTPARNGS